MAGSGASNLGYGNESPFSNSPYVNDSNSNYSGNFGSTTIPGTPPGPLPGLAGTKWNVDAAAGVYPGKGGRRLLKRQIKNITKYYKKMKPGSRKIRHLKSVLRRRSSRTHKRCTHKRCTHKQSAHKRTRMQRGGYAQYQNNMPLTPSYQVAGVHLSPSQSMLANPAPIKVIDANCIDNYNHYTNMGFPSKGH